MLSWMAPFPQCHPWERRQGRCRGRVRYLLRMAIILCRYNRSNCTDRALAGAALLEIVRGNRRKESVRSTQHRLLGKDTRHRTLGRCLGD